MNRRIYNFKQLHFGMNVAPIIFQQVLVNMLADFGFLSNASGRYFDQEFIKISICLSCQNNYTKTRRIRIQVS